MAPNRDLKWLGDASTPLYTRPDTVSIEIWRILEEFVSDMMGNKEELFHAIKRPRIDTKLNTTTLNDQMSEHSSANEYHTRPFEMSHHGISDRGAFERVEDIKNQVVRGNITGNMANDIPEVSHIASSVSTDIPCNLSELSKSKLKALNC